MAVPLKFFIVAGEASADMYAADILKNLKERYPESSALGVGGENLKREGLEIVVNAADLSLMGIAEWAHKIPEVWGNYKKVVSSLKASRPDVAILLDLPDFNLMLAKQIKKLGIPVVYYISPQVWAWRKYRVHKIRRLVDKMLVLFPFEERFYKEHNVDAEFVGHPLLDVIAPISTVRSQKEVLEAPRVAILPGSRKSEIRFLSALLNETMGELKKLYPTIQFKIPVAPTLSIDEVRKAFPSNVELVAGDSFGVRRWADLALVTSGTATLETALLGLPFCLFYKVSRSSSFVFKYVAKYTGWIGMPNVLLQKEIAPEFFQENANAANLIAYCKKAIENEAYRNTQRDELLKCRKILGSGNAIEKATNKIAGFLSEMKNGKSTQTQFAPA